MPKDTTSKRAKKPSRRRPEEIPFPANQEPTFGISLIQEKLIGRAVVEWARVEAALNEIIWELLGLSLDDGRVLTQRSDANTKIAALRVLVPRYLKGEQLERMEQALAAADIVRDDRNFIAHGSWGTLQPSGLPVALSLRAKSPPDQIMSEGFPRERMLLIIKNTILVRQSLVMLLSELIASREKSE